MPELTVPEGAVVPATLFWINYPRAKYRIYAEGGSAIAGSDYSAGEASGTAQGTAQATLLVRIVDDDRSEETETVNLVATIGDQSFSATIVIEDNDKPRCILDIDGDGIAEEVEISFSEGFAMLRRMQQMEAIYSTELENSRLRIIALADEASAVKKEATAQIISLMGTVASLGLTGTVGQMIKGLPKILSTMSDIVNSDPDGAKDAWVRLATEFTKQIENLKQYVPVVGLLTAVGNSLDAAKRLNESAIEINQKLAQMKIRADQAAESLDNVTENYLSLLKCLIEEARKSGSPVIYADAPSHQTDGPSGAEIYLLDATSLAPGLFISEGTSGNDHLVARLSLNSPLTGNAVMSAGAGDDLIDILGGSAFLDGGAGFDEVILRSAGGTLLNRAAVAFADVVEDPGGVVIGLADNSLVAAGNVEFVGLADGYIAIASGKAVIKPLSVALQNTNTNVLRSAWRSDDPLELARQSFQADKDAGKLGQYIQAIVSEADATTSVATLSYQFFTGKIPTSGGIDYLVSPTGPNPNNLNSAYFQSFNLENRYINFAVNLGKLGEGKAAFAAEYGGLSLAAATKLAYGEIFGAPPTDAKVAAILSGGRDLYFEAYGRDGLNGIGTKAAMVGWLLAEAEKADIGIYAKSNAAFLTDLADGATYNVDLIAAYAKPEYTYLGE